MNNNANQLPILYSFRRCPYAMRARLAIKASGCAVELREVVLRNKPAEMLAASPKATVPVLVLADGRIIEESLQIMQWVLANDAGMKWLPAGSDESVCMALIKRNDDEFKHWLDRYKYCDRYPAESMEYYRQQGEAFLAELEQRLRNQSGLISESYGLADWAILPFVRQFAQVDRSWFDAAPYPALQHWLETGLTSQLFASVMKKYSPWQTGEALVIFGQDEGLSGLSETD